MLKKSTKILVFISILLCIVAVFQAKNFGNATGIPTPTRKSSGNLPVRKARIYFAPDQREQLFEQFRKFASQHAFAIKITLVNPIEQQYIVEIWGGDIELSALDTDPGVFAVGLYNKDPTHPSPSTEFEKLMNELEELILKISDISFVIEK